MTVAGGMSGPASAVKEDTSETVQAVRGFPRLVTTVLRGIV